MMPADWLAAIPIAFADAVRRKSEQLGGRGCRAEHAASRGDMPAARIMPGRHRISDPAFDLDPENERRDHVPAGKPPRLRQRQNRRRDRRSRMNDRVQMGIVEIQQVGRDRIDEGRAERIEPLRPADDRRCRGAAERRQRPQRGRDGRIIGRAERGCEEIQDRAFRFVTLRGDIRPRACRQRNLRALRRRLALDPAALSEFLDRRFSNPIPAGRGLSILILLLDRLTDNLDIRKKGRATARATNNNALALCGATGSESHG